MGRIAGCLAVLLVWAGGAVAQCQVPNMAPPTEETSDTDRRALYLAFTEFQICHYERGAWRGDYLPGDEVFVGKVVSALRVQRQDMISRSGLPTQAQFHAVAAQPDRQRAFADMIRYVELAQGCAECATGASAVELEMARSALAST